MAKSTLDDGMDVFHVARPRECLLVDLALDPFEAVEYLPALALGEDLRSLQHAHVGDAPADVVVEDPTVEVKRAGKAEHASIEPGLEAPGPKRSVRHLRDFLDDVYEHFDAGGRSFPVEREDQDLGMRAVEEGLFDHEWRSGKLILLRRRS